MEELFKFQETTESLPALKKRLPGISQSSKVLIFTKKNGYEFARAINCKKMHDAHELPEGVSEDGDIFSTESNELIPVWDVLAWAPVPTRKPDLKTKTQ